MIRFGLGLGLIPTAARPVPTTPPMNDVAPSVMGTRTQGQTLTADPGAWTGLPSAAYAYQWQRWNGASWPNIAAATNATYVAQAADVSAGANALRVAVTATNDLGSTTANSAGVTIAAPLTITGTPGGASVGSAYSFTPGTAGGHTPKTFALTGTLPAGLSFSPSTGAITGTPSSSGTAADLNITVTDADGLTASLGAFSLVVSAGGEPTVVTLTSALMTTGMSLPSGFEVPAGQKGMTRRSQGYNGVTPSDTLLAGTAEDLVSADATWFPNKAVGGTTPAQVATVFTGLTGPEKAMHQFTAPFRNEIPNEATAGIEDVANYDLTHMATIWGAKTHNRIIVMGPTGGEARGVERWARRRMAIQALWRNYSGYVFDAHRKLVLSGSGTGQDLTDAQLDRAPYTFVVGTDGPDYIHWNQAGNQVQSDTTLGPVARAWEGYRPFITDYEEVFLSGAAAIAAQANAGAVHTVVAHGASGGGHTSGITFSLPAQAHSAHFAINSATGAITRASATVLTAGCYDLTVRVANSYGYREGVRRIFFGKHNTAPKVKSLNGSATVVTVNRTLSLPAANAKGSIAMRVRPQGSGNRTFLGPNNGRVILQLLSNRWGLIARNSSNTIVINTQARSGLTHASNVWGWVYFSWDLTGGSPVLNVGLELDGSSADFATPATTTLTGTTNVDTAANTGLFSGTNSPTAGGLASPMPCDLEQFLLMPGVCIDWTDPTKRALVRDATTRAAVDLGGTPSVEGVTPQYNLGELSAGDLAYGNLGGAYGLFAATFLPDPAGITG